MDSAGKLRVEEWPTERLVEYVRNPRKNDPHVDRMAGMIKEFGFRIPIVAKSDGTVVDGHLRLKAARKLGLPTVPVALADGLTEPQIKAFRILANKSVAWSDWDTDLLVIELGEFPDGFNLELTGFTTAEIDLLVHGQGNPIDPTKEWDGMPEFDQEDQLAFRTIKVHFKDQQSVDDFSRVVAQAIAEKAKFIWFPPAERGVYADKRYSSGES